MPRKTLEVSVNPAVLRWARESSGVGIEEVAKRVRTSVETVAKWESGDRQPTLRILEELAAFYKRPLAIFFLPQPPQEPPLPHDFRVLPGKESLPLSKETRLAIREARRLQTIAMELMKEMEREVKVEIGKTTLKANPEEVAANERKRFGISIEEQLGWRDRYEAFRKWRQAIERLNVLVFQMRMPIEEARGFSLLDGKLPVIVVNAYDAIYARIFTLFHEYAHLLLGTSGVCLPEESSVAEAIEVESFCNHFAGAFLVPKDTLLKNEQVRALAQAITVPNQAIEQIAKQFKVSKHVIWRRMQLADLISLEKYKTKCEEWEREAERRGQRKQFFRVHPSKRCIQEKGLRFTSLVLEAKYRDLITYSDVADYLSIRVKYLEKVQSLLGEKRMNA